MPRSWPTRKQQDDDKGQEVDEQSLPDALPGVLTLPRLQRLRFNSVVEPVNELIGLVANPVRAILLVLVLSDLDDLVAVSQRDAIQLLGAVDDADSLRSRDVLIPVPRSGEL